MCRVGLDGTTAVRLYRIQLIFGHQATRIEICSGVAEGIRFASHEKERNGLALGSWFDCDKDVFRAYATR